MSISANAVRWFEIYVQDMPILFQVDVNEEEDVVILRQVQMFFWPWEDDVEFEDAAAPASSGPPSRCMRKGNIGKRREAVTGGHAAGGRATGGCCDANPNQKPRSHDTSRIAWAKLMARVGEEFPLECPNCGGDIRLRADGRQEPAPAK
jgi:hypothetical protein